MEDIQKHLNSTQFACQISCALGGDLNIANLLSSVADPSSNAGFVREIVSNSVLANIKTEFWEKMLPKLDTDFVPANSILNTQSAEYLATLQKALQADFPILGFQSGKTAAILTMDYIEKEPTFGVYKLEANGSIDVSLKKIYDLETAIYVLKEVKRDVDKT